MDKLDIGRREERVLDSDLTQGSASNDYNSTNDTVQSKQESAVRAIVAALKRLRHRQATAGLVSASIPLNRTARLSLPFVHYWAGALGFRDFPGLQAVKENRTGNCLTLPKPIQVSS